MNTMETDALNERLEDVRGKLVKTISQMKLIELKLRDLNQRYKRASTNKKNSFRYHLRMRMSITAGVKLMYMQYLTMKAEEVRVMEQSLSAMRNQQQQQQPPHGGAAVAEPETSAVSHSDDQPAPDSAHS